MKWERLSAPGGATGTKLRLATLVGRRFLGLAALLICGKLIKLTAPKTTPRNNVRRALLCASKVVLVVGFGHGNCGKPLHL